MGLSMRVESVEARAMADRLGEARTMLRSSTQRRMLSELTRLQPRVQAVYESLTPVLTGRLRASTDVQVTREPGSLTASLDVRQPATTPTGDEYWQWVVYPHRIVAWGHDTGRMSTGNPYPEQAQQALAPELSRAALTVGHGAMIDTVAVIKRGNPV